MTDEDPEMSSSNLIGKSQPVNIVDSDENISKFVHAYDPFVWDRMLSMGDVSTVDVIDNDYSSTALMYSSDMTDGKPIDKVSYLLTCKPPADINKQDISGYTALYCAALYNNIDVLKVLIDFNGNRSLTDKYNNDTPLQVAKKCNKKETAKMLEEYFPTEE